jgi:hypothetical protein
MIVQMRGVLFLESKFPESKSPAAPKTNGASRQPDCTRVVRHNARFFSAIGRKSFQTVAFTPRQKALQEKP